MKLIEKFIDKYAAFWISPDGVIIPVDSIHIQTVLDFPEKFGYTEDELRSMYKRGREPYGHEGKVRGKIMTTLMKQGWIRIRFVDRTYTWVVEFSGDLSRKKRDYVWEFFVRLSGEKIGTLQPLYKKGIFSPSAMDVELHSIDKDIWHHCEMSEVIAMSDEFFQESVIQHHTSFSLIENYVPKSKL